MNDDAAGVGGMFGDDLAGDEDGSDRALRDHTRLQRRAVFLTELENARRLVARAREADTSLMVRELVGRRTLLRGR